MSDILSKITTIYVTSDNTHFSDIEDAKEHERYLFLKSELEDSDMRLEPNIEAIATFFSKYFDVFTDRMTDDGIL